MDTITYQTSGIHTPMAQIVLKITSQAVVALSDQQHLVNI